jgi:predicted RNase H-like HicB family nuclease
MFQASFTVWSHLLGGALAVGIIGVIASIIEQKHRLSHQASGITTMVEFPATVERAADGTWTAAIVREHSVLGTGASKEGALEDLRKGVAGLVECLNHKDEAIPNRQSSL